MKRVIIIGASSGIGKELALLYAEKGCLVGITGRRAELLTTIASERPGQLIAAPFDATAGDSQQQVQALIDRLGGLDLFIYNAGFGTPSAAFDLQKEVAITRTNALACVELTGFAFDYFLRHGTGQIAITSSVAGLLGNSRAPAYSASKAFVSNWAEGLNIKAHRLKARILVTDIRPGFVDTKDGSDHNRFWEATPPEAARQMLLAIEKRKRVAYVTRRWWLVAQLMKIVPYALYRRVL